VARNLVVRAGPSGLLAFLLLFGSLVIFGYAISAPVWIAISAALFILAITLGIYATGTSRRRVMTRRISNT